MIRQPAVAGSFYPKEEPSLLAAVRSLTSPETPKSKALGVVVPHAGYVYSGAVAGEVYSRIRLPERYFLLCPNHTGAGAPLAVVSSGWWRTPLGDVAIDQDLAEALKAANPEVRESADAHRREHALEVQIPFLQYLAEGPIRFVPIVIGTSDLDCLLRLGESMADQIRRSGTEVLLVASSDMNHYEPDARTRVKDRWAIDRMLDRDPEGLHHTVLDRDISMCGFGPATSVLEAANRLGATRAELVDYRTSGDAFGERDRVVGYAGIVIS